MDFFFYGTLMDSDVLAGVLGRRVPAGHRRRAEIEGFVRVCVAGARYPTLVAAPGRVAGFMVSGLDGGDARRLDHFEGQQYERIRVPVRLVRGGTGEAWTYLTRDGVTVSQDAWEFDAWRRRFKRDYARRVAGWMRAGGVDSRG